jgi:hypothetical protein
MSSEGSDELEIARDHPLIQDISERVLKIALTTHLTVKPLPGGSPNSSVSEEHISAGPNPPQVSETTADQAVAAPHQDQVSSVQTAPYGAQLPVPFPTLCWNHKSILTCGESN